MKTFKLALIPALLSTLLGGCAVYGPPVAYSQPYYQAAPHYGPPVYVVPQPVYIAPPVRFGFNFGYWGGGRGRGHGGHHRH